MEWTTCLDGLWLFPLVCVAFMAIMMIGCGALMFRGWHGAHGCGREDRPDGGPPRDA